MKASFLWTSRGLFFREINIRQRATDKYLTGPHVGPLPIQQSTERHIHLPAASEEIPDQNGWYLCTSDSWTDLSIFHQ